MVKSTIVIMLLLALPFGTASFAGAMAGEGCGGFCASCHSLTVSEANGLLTGVGRVTKVETSPVGGLWLLHLEKEQRHGIAFLDYGKKNLIVGTVFPLQPKVEAGKAAAVPDVPGLRVDVAAIPLDNSIVLGNPAAKKRLVVFTDPECSFCARLHEELKMLVAMEPDIAVYVKMYPLAMHPRAYDKARAILGGDGPALLDSAFAGSQLPVPGPDSGKNAVDETIRIARSLSIDATPTLVLPDGRQLAGFRDAETLRNLLGDVKK